MGAVAISGKIYKALMTGPENTIEFLHGYTYSGHPVASAAGLAVLGIAKKEGLFERAAELAPYFEEAVHSLKGITNVIDIGTLASPQVWIGTTWRQTRRARF